MLVKEIVRTNWHELTLTGVVPESLNAVNETTGETFPIPFTSSGHRWSISFEALSNLLPSRVSVYGLLVQQRSDEESEPLHVHEYETIPIWRRYYRSSAENSPVMPHIFIDEEGWLKLIIDNPTDVDHKSRYFRHRHDIDTLRIHHRNIKVGFSVYVEELGQFSIERCFLKLASNDERIELAPSQLKIDRDFLSARAIFSISEEEQLLPLRYWIYISLKDHDSGEQIYLRIYHAPAALYRKLHHRNKLTQSIALSSGRVLTLATSIMSTTINFLVRSESMNETHPFGQHLFSFIARSEMLLRRIVHLPVRPTALLYEKDAATAQDNAYALFLYMLEYRGQVPFDFYYVMDSRSPQASRVSDVENVVLKFSLNYWRLLASSNTFTVGSDTRFHLANVYSEPGLLTKFLYVRKNYFLQHGVTGLKRVPLFKPGKALTPDFYCATSEWEKQVLVEAGVAADSIDVTGFPRWDRLSTTQVSKSESRHIVYMPTWRNWLEGRDATELSTSDYVRTILRLLTSSTLHEMLIRHNARLSFIPHPKFKDLSNLMHEVKDNIEILHQDEVEFATLIRNADAIITDFSSVLWDFVQSRKPVILFQFDKERYDREIGSFENYELRKIQAGFRSASTVENLLQELEALLVTEAGELAESTDHLARLAFPYRDTCNSARSTQALTDRLPELVTTRFVPSYERADHVYSRRVKRAQEANQIAIQHERLGRER